MNRTSQAFIDTGVIVASAAILAGIFFILLLTRNVIILILSLISISEVIVSVVAWINMVRWKYGLVELLSALVVNGFPLDMVIRLTLEYHGAPR